MYVEESYPLLMADRLGLPPGRACLRGAGRRRARSLVERTLIDAGAGATLRLRAIRVPVDLEALGNVLDGRPAPRAVRAARGSAEPRPPTRAGARPRWARPCGGCWRHNWSRSGQANDERPADAVVVGRSVPPQQGETARLLRGFYEGLASWRPRGRGRDVPGRANDR